MVDQSANQNIKTRAVVVGVQLPNADDHAFQASLAELERLADTLGLEVIGRITQRRGSLSSAVVGEGKLKELAEWTGGRGYVPAYSPPGKGRDETADDDDDDETEEEQKKRAAVVLVDHDLKPSKLRNLEQATGAEVMDRSMVILSIFQRHARTREARLQVEIAQLAYMSPRLREANAGQDRQRGGIGGKGAGESSLELDRRKIRDRIAELREELASIEKEEKTRRARRLDACTVALVGYTNAGKSSLMRALTGDEVYVADQLFATLGTTVRVLSPETKPRILVSDTVGFIKKLPHDLVASFRSTLEEARDAKLLLHVVDASDPEFRSQMKVTEEVLTEIGADQTRLVVLNKSDCLSEEEKFLLGQEFQEAVIVSARSKQDIAKLHSQIVKCFDEMFEEETFHLSYDQQRFVSKLHDAAHVIEERFEEEGTFLRVRGTASIIGRFRREIHGIPQGEEDE